MLCVAIYVTILVTLHVTGCVITLTDLQKDLRALHGNLKAGFAT